MAKRSYHIVPHERGWALKEEGRQEPLSTFDTQKEAIEEGRSKAAGEDDQVDLIIHRTDGTIRDRLSYSDTNGNGKNAPNGREKKERLEPEDVLPVWSRVSWPAVLAGVVIALTTFTTLSILGAAIGLSLTNSVDDGLRYVAAAWTLLAWLVSLFLGGYAVSQTTAGETKCEAVLYGLVHWGTTMLTVGLIVAAFNNYGMGNLLGRALYYTSAEEAAQNVMRDPDSAWLAWATFGSILLSLMASVAGAVVGAGPELVFVNRMDRRDDVPANKKVAAR